MAERTTRTRRKPVAKKAAKAEVVALRPAIGRKVTAAERKVQAIELRKAGATYQAIGDQIGVSRQAVHKMIQATLREWNETTHDEAEEMRAIELERLDAMQVGLWSAATRGDTKAVDGVLKIMDRRARYLGLDLPTVAPEGTGLFEVAVRYVEAFRTD